MSEAEVVIPDLTPPTKTAKAPKEKKAKEPKEPKVVDPNAPKKERAPRTDYGYAKDAVLEVKVEAESKYRGARKKWFDSLIAFNGKTVGEWEEDRKAAGEKDPPRGWLRFYVVDEETVNLKKTG